MDLQATPIQQVILLRCLQDPLNNYNTDTSDQGGTDTATTGQIGGGGYNTSSGPVTLKTIGPQ